jgi:hypothetical protein
MVTAEQKELVLSKIRGEELAELVLKLAQVESPSGSVEESAEPLTAPIATPFPPPKRHLTIA